MLLKISYLQHYTTLKDSVLYISAQVINEFINITGRKIQNTIPLEKQMEIITFFQDVFVVIPLTGKTSMKALQLKKRYGFSYWDSLLETI
jgi:predicted nucleic acid-binding protein